MQSSNLLNFADRIESNPGSDCSKHYDRSVLHDTYQGGVKFSETAGFQCMYNSCFAICFSLIKKVSLWKSNDINFIADQSHLSSLTGAEPFSIDDLPSFVVIKEHVVQAQMVLHYSGLFTSVVMFLIITRIWPPVELVMVQFFALPDIVSLSYGTKNPSSYLMFTVVLMKVSMFQLRRLFCFRVLFYSSS